MGCFLYMCGAPTHTSMCPECAGVVSRACFSYFLFHINRFLLFLLDFSLFSCFSCFGPAWASQESQASQKQEKQERQLSECKNDYFMISLYSPLDRCTITLLNKKRS